MKRKREGYTSINVINKRDWIKSDKLSRCVMDAIEQDCAYKAINAVRNYVSV